MSKVLKMKFLNGEDKSKLISLAQPKENLTADEVRSVMTTIANANVFEKDAVPMYVKPQEAYYSETVTNQVFDDTEDATEDAAA